MRFWKRPDPDHQAIRALREVNRRLTIARVGLTNSEYDKGWRDCLDFIDSGLTHKPPKKAHQSRVTHRVTGGTNYGERP